jgi:hypothetical protein
MYPIWIVLLFGALFSTYVAIETPKQDNLLKTAQADVSVTNLIAYRKAVLRYLEVNPSTTGTISDASLAAYWLPGYIRDANWTNVISGSTLYIYSTASVTRSTLDLLYVKSQNSAMIGRKHDTNGKLISANGFDTGVNLPAAIPSNAIVILGK